ncbi:MAG: hypothetical protein HZB16_06990 [Armatimonadetes bacterium]|nr:hypothetical protein [Armatimonadota bacterium]
MVTAFGALRASAAAVDVTPPVGAWLAGFEQNRVAETTHDPLWARAIALAVGEVPLVLVAVDCIGLLAADCDRIADGLPIPREQVIVCATHTHSGPDTIGLWGPDPRTRGVDEVVLTHIVDGAREAAREALAQLVPARLTLASTGAPTRCAVNLRDPASIDPEISVMRFTDRDGHGLATLINWACHPEVLRSSSHAYSSDFAHGLRGRVEESLGGIALFANGALGAMVTTDAAADTFDEARRIGGAVGDEAVAAVAREGQGTDWLTLNLASETLAVAVETAGFRAALAAGLLTRELSSDGEARTRMTALTLGNATLVTCPGELQPRVGRRWKRLMQRPYRFLVGLAQDELGYVLDREDFGNHRYAYESGMCMGPDTAIRLTVAAQRLLRAVQG